MQPRATAPHKMAPVEEGWGKVKHWELMSLWGVLLGDSGTSPSGQDDFPGTICPDHPVCPPSALK